MNHTQNFKKSEEYLKTAEAVIPLASQTFSKSRLAYPMGVSPYFLEKGQGSKVWDIDGNVFTDYVNGLLSVSVGYCDSDIDDAVRTQMTQGVSFSLPHRLETEVAELLVSLIPCAEMVRFGKNGSDATSAAIRLARAHTQREHIAVCGYHGWHDWYIGSTTRNLGVPECVRSLTHAFEYNDIESLLDIVSEHPNEMAAVIMEPMNISYPNDDFLKKVREVCDRNDIVLVFDETITGFRHHISGAQALFNVTPDLATFGKGMANGYPISAIVGRRDLMKGMEHIFFSGTFGGETLSLAAAKATIEKLVEIDGPKLLERHGEKLMHGLRQIIKGDLSEIFSVAGHPAWSFLLMKAPEGFSENQVSSLMQQEMHKRGILVNGSHNISCSHTSEDIDDLLMAYSEVLPFVDSALKTNTFDKHFKGMVTEPIFKVR